MCAPRSGAALRPRDSTKAETQDGKLVPVGTKAIVYSIACFRVHSLGSMTWNDRG